MKFWQVDSFTSVPFSGNPAAVFVTDKPLADSLMADIAAEMNLAETAFVTLQPELRIRWFTPTVEVDLCGHATLAAAHILWERGFIDTDAASFASLSGALGIAKNGDGYTLDFPSSRRSNARITGQSCRPCWAAIFYMPDQMARIAL